MRISDWSSDVCSSDLRINCRDLGLGFWGFESWAWLEFAAGGPLMRRAYGRSEHEEWSGARRARRQSERQPAVPERRGRDAARLGPPSTDHRAVIQVNNGINYFARSPRAQPGQSLWEQATA